MIIFLLGLFHIMVYILCLMVRDMYYDDDLNLILYCLSLKSEHNKLYDDTMRIIGSSRYIIISFLPILNVGWLVIWTIAIRALKRLDGTK